MIIHGQFHTSLYVGMFMQVHLVRLVEHDVLPVVDGHVEAGHPVDGRADDVQVAPAQVQRLAREERAVQVAHVVVHRTAAAVPDTDITGIDAKTYKRTTTECCISSPPGQADFLPPEEGHVGLGPWVLVAANHHARAVAPQQKQVLCSNNESW